MIGRCTRSILCTVGFTLKPVNLLAQAWQIIWIEAAYSATIQHVLFACVRRSNPTIQQSMKSTICWMQSAAVWLKCESMLSLNSFQFLLFYKYYHWTIQSLTLHIIVLTAVDGGGSHIIPDCTLNHIMNITCDTSFDWLCYVQVQYTCTQQKDFGQCNASFMQPQLNRTSFCAITCGRCAWSGKFAYSRGFTIFKIRKLHHCL